MDPKQGSSRGTKDFIKVLFLFKEHDEDRVIKAVERAVSAQVSTSDAVEHILLNDNTSKGPCFVPLESWPRLSPPDVSVYSRIGGEL